MATRNSKFLFLQVFDITNVLLEHAAAMHLMFPALFRNLGPACSGGHFLTFAEKVESNTLI